tara:strand:+ start:1329 stop:1574 length:246 start_codon:yes stop_codon:yes gene_type:complete
MISCLTFTLGFSAGLGVSIISFSLSVIAPAALREVNPIEYAHSKGEDVQFDNRGYRCIEIRRVKTIKEAKELVNLYKDLSK